MAWCGGRLRAIEDRDDTAVFDRRTTRLAAVGTGAATLRQYTLPFRPPANLAKVMKGKPQVSRSCNRRVYLR
ncbi:hypothetical protein SAMN05428979_3406 [Stappia sp. ES.058]|nr:hypothetical protein SAMN05428979_3406 [Stappia sp. ES.058]